MTDQEEIATMFKALGDPTRLKIFQFLRGCCGAVAVEEGTGDVRPMTGPTVGDICCNVIGTTVITSTISFHLKELRQARLIMMERQGRHMICGINPAAVTKIADYLGRKGEWNDECC